MTTLREAAQAVLDRWDSPRWEWHQGPTAALMADLRAALEKPEPCRYPDCVDNGPDGKCTRWLLDECAGPVQEPVATLYGTLPIYDTAPPQRKPLTEEEVGKVAAPYYGTMGFRVEAFARAIERAHGIEEKA